MDGGIRYTVAQAIIEDSWFQLQYENKNKEITSFYFGVTDIDYRKGILTGSQYNPEKSEFEYLENTHIHIDKIRTASIVPQSFFPTPKSLKDCLEEDANLQVYLEMDKADNDILTYLLQCSRNDESPFIEEYITLPGVDFQAFQKNKQIELSDEDFDTLIQKMFRMKRGKRDFQKSTATLGMNLLSIDRGEGRFVVAYRVLRLNFQDHTLTMARNSTINPSFLMDVPRKDGKTKGAPVSLSNYIDISPDEFIRTFDENRQESRMRRGDPDFVSYFDMIRENVSQKANEKVDTIPMIFSLNRNSSLALEKTFDSIRKMEKEKELTVPLKAFFGKNLAKPGTTKEHNIVVFDKKKINIDQMRVIHNSMRNHVTYVQGPPGTGKTETIFNVLLSAYANEKKVLVCSNNNHPLDDIFKKMSDSFPFLTNYGLLFPVVRLRSGLQQLESADTILELRAFFEMAQKAKDKNTFDSITNRQKHKCMASFEELKELINRYEVIQESRLRLKQLNGLLKTITSPKIHEETERQYNIERNRLAELGTIENNEVANLAISANEDKSFQDFVHYSVLARLKKLNSPKFDELRGILTLDDQEAVAKFNAYLKSSENLKLFLSVFPIVIATNQFSANLGPAGHCSFDLCIMDEAGQCNIANALIAISRSRDLLLVGDTNQLQPVTVLDPTTNDKLRETYHVRQEYDYIENSILSTMMAKDRISKSIMLRYHYRCGKQIANFVNQRFYGEKLKLLNQNPGSLAFYDVKNRKIPQFRNGYVEEATQIVNLLKEGKYKDVAIVTPFVHQKNLINYLLAKEGINDVEAGTIHSLQGSEKSTIILSTAISLNTSRRTMDWIKDNHELINVAVTRAKENLIVVADKGAIDALSGPENNDLKALTDYVSSNGAYNVPKSKKTIVTDFSNDSQSEMEFFDCISIYFNKARNKFRTARNVQVTAAIPGVLEEHLQMFGKKEFDVVVSVSETPFKPRYKTKVVFEIDGGEHIGSARQARLDREKEKICNFYGIKLIRIANSQVRDYELIINLFECVTNNMSDLDEQSENYISLLDFA